MPEQLIYLISEEQVFASNLASWVTGKYNNVTIKNVDYSFLEVNEFAGSSKLLIFIVDKKIHIDLIKDFQNKYREILTIVFVSQKFLLEFSGLIDSGVYALFPIESLSDEKVNESLEKAINYNMLKSDAKNNNLIASIPELKNLEDFIFRDKKIQRLMLEINKIAQTDYNILLLGETGVGKNTIAKTIHHLSPRRNNIYRHINSANLSKELLQSNLFGHVKGAFTGANKDKKGAFEICKNGTVFIDEVGAMDQDVQTMLLTVMDMEPKKRKFYRMGDDEKEIVVDLRIITATNSNIEEESSGFRRDLFQRLGKAFIIPPLRERLDDIPALANYFLQKYSPSKSLAFTDEAMNKLLEYHWPGNIRELENVIKNVCIYSSNIQVFEDDIKFF